MLESTALQYYREFDVFCCYVLCLKAAIASASMFCVYLTYWLRQDICTDGHGLSRVHVLTSAFY